MNEQTQAVLFSSDKRDWETPDDLFAARHKLFNFDVDVCADADNAKLPNFISPEQDTFKADWILRFPAIELAAMRTAPPAGTSYDANTREYVRPARCWMNPPYGDPEFPCKKNKAGEYRCKKKVCVERGSHNDIYVPGIYDFVKLAAEKRLLGNLTDCLLPARTDVEWWHEFVWDEQTDKPRPGVKVKLLKGRLKFKGAPNGAPFPSVLVTFVPDGFLLA